MRRSRSRDRESVGDERRRFRRRTDRRGALCETSEQCASGFCGGYLGADTYCGLCVAPAQRGQPCGDTPCDYELGCFQSKCIEPGLEGEGCSTDNPCAITWCNQGMCAPKLSIGSDCDPNEVWLSNDSGSINYQCVPGAACNMLTSKCEVVEPDGRVGEPCWLLADDSLGLCRHAWCQLSPTGEGTCIAQKEHGEPCSTANNIIGRDSDCALFQLCIDGTCRYAGDILVCY